MRQDYYTTLLDKKAFETWFNLTELEQVKHTLQGSKVYKDYQRAIHNSDKAVTEYSDHYIDAITQDDFTLLEDYN